MDTYQVTTNNFALKSGYSKHNPFSDRYGRKPLLMICLIGTVVGFVILGMAESVSQLFLSRVVDGLLGGNIALAQTIASDLTTPENRSRSFGMIGAAFGIGFIIGPAFGGTFANWHFRLPAYIAAFITLLNLIGVYAFLPETLPKLTPNKLETPMFGAFSALSSSLKIPILRELLILRFFFQFVFTLFETSFGFYNLTVFGLDARSSSYLLAFVGVLFAVVQAGIRAFKNIKEAKLIMYSFAIFAVSLAWWCQTSSIMSLQMSLVPLSLSSGLLNTLVSSLITRQVKNIELGGILGVSSAVGSLTRVLAPMSSGVLIDSFGINAPGMFGALLMLFCVFFIIHSKFDQLTFALTPTTNQVPEKKQT